jgi:hypothetical protein
MCVLETQLTQLLKIDTGMSYCFTEYTYLRKVSSLMVFHLIKFTLLIRSEHFLIVLAPDKVLVHLNQ